jgi:hypothetical protein
MTEDRGASYLDLFIEVTNAITINLNLDEVFILITQKISKVMDVDAATIRLLDASGKKTGFKGITWPEPVLLESWSHRY